MLYALWTLAALLVIAWLLGVGGAFAVDGWFHLLLIGAVLAVLASLFTRPHQV
jgi:hypothetical protein